MYFRDSMVWVVGASGGIGEFVAYEFARQGARLFLTARRIDKLEQVAAKCRDLGGTASLMRLDVTDGSEIESVCHHVIDSYQGVDILINNSGISQRALAIDSELVVDRRIMEVNYFGLVAITKRMLPGMIERGSGRIAFTSSVVGKFGFFERSAYSASKHAIHGFADAVNLENNKHGVYVTVVCPGRVKTEISFHALGGQGEKHGVLDPGQATGMSAEKCARKYVNAVRRYKREVYIGKESLLIYLRRYLPFLFYIVASRASAR